MAEGLKGRSREALTNRDLGEEVDDGFYIKDLGTVTHTPDRSKAEVEQADPVSKLTRKTLREREALVGQMAAQLMDYYVEHLNDPLVLNPIRDGIPECVQHRFPVGCTHGCKTGVMPRVRDYTLGDVFAWVQGVIKNNYTDLMNRRPELRGYSSGII